MEAIRATAKWSVWLTATVLMLGCGEAPPPPPKAEPPKTVRVHVSNGAGVDICRVEACGNVGRAVGSEPSSATSLTNTRVKPHEASMFEIKKCSGTLKVTACPTENPTPVCLKAEGGYVDEGTMFRVSPCSL